MPTMLSGPFSARNLAERDWLLTTGDPAGPEIYLRGAHSGAGQLLSGSAIARLGVAWDGDGVELTLWGADGVRSLRAATAVVHDPKPGLYAGLPLAGFDADARRFWTRVFRLMRIPGGRYLLALIARRHPNKRQ